MSAAVWSAAGGLSNTPPQETSAGHPARGGGFCWCGREGREARFGLSVWRPLTDAGRGFSVHARNVWCGRLWCALRFAWAAWCAVQRGGRR